MTMKKIRKRAETKLVATVDVVVKETGPWILLEKATLSQDHNVQTRRKKGKAKASPKAKAIKRG